MSKREIIERLKNIARHAVHIFGEEPFVMSLDDGIAVYEVIELLENTEPRKHGCWIKDSSGAEFCSECNQYPYDDGEYHIANWHSRYCPHCGAKMDDGE